MKKTALIMASVTLLAFSACKVNENNEKENKEDLIAEIQSDEDFRPNFHFTPDKNWMNDPNGMFYLNGKYHLFFQHHPEGNTWGPMHWGHATSEDLISWKEQPVALAPDSIGYIFSGSAVVDTNNTSGFGNGETAPVIAMFTYHDPQGEKNGNIDYQTQALAYSLDEGKTWKKYKNNPVIDNPGIKDFRDPKMQWDEARKQWVMVLAADDKTLFYTSPNLIDWELVSEFGKGIGAHGGVWECPDFFPMQVEGSNEVKWVLLQSLNPGAYNGGSGTQYFVGDFDGKNFTPVKQMQNLGAKHSYWLDFGKDNYAGVTWSNIPESDGRKLFIGWMSNWQYAEVVPTETWRSAMTLPRELKLKKEGDDYRIHSQPVRELDEYKSSGRSTTSLNTNDQPILIADDNIDLSSTHIKFEIPNPGAGRYEFKLGNATGDTLEFGYAAAENHFFINREKSGIVDFSDNFAENISTAPRTSESDNLQVQLILDKSSIELFYDNGETVMTELIFPKQPYETLTLETSKNSEITNLKINELKKDL